MSVTPSPTPAATRAWWPALVGQVQALRRTDGPVPFVWAYLAALSVAEVLTTLIFVDLGLLLYLVVLVALLVHAALRRRTRDHRWLLCLGLIPLIRIISVSLPLAAFPLIYWIVITSVPLFATSFMIMRQLGIAWPAPRANWLGLPFQLLVGFTGIGLGYLEYLILRPEPLVESLSWNQIWLPALILLVGTGFLEELVFRHILQKTAVERWGNWRGILYVSFLFALLHIGYRSVLDVLFVFVVGLYFSWVMIRTRSLVGITLAHGLTNIMLFLVIPFLAPAAPGTPPADVAFPGTVPAVVEALPQTALDPAQAAAVAEQTVGEFPQETAASPGDTAAAPAVVESDVPPTTLDPALSVAVAEQATANTTRATSPSAPAPVGLNQETITAGVVRQPAAEPAPAAQAERLAPVLNAPPPGFWQTKGLWLLLVLGGVGLMNLMLFIPRPEKASKPAGDPPRS